MDRGRLPAYAPPMNDTPRRDPPSATPLASESLGSDPLAWRPVKAPSLAEFEVIAIEAFRKLPAHFRARCEGVVVQVEDYATDEVLDAMGIASELDLMGLFQGVGLPFQIESAPAAMPNMVWLYRVPILLYWAEHDETLGTIITHVLVHEIGHHFGLSDDDIDAIERMADEPENQGANEP
jgi:predicted Zn-dependent protease with MMP-like domain